ncbi:hypothetical protein Ciccas_013658 [Cichlidogyrus casuarinus]|uniref:Uncharacterized protein n=1 Tax=Cichlidogyrus casuarinus TaxID=1844966 RepID=A0ABD2PLI0_9PLAT
MSKAIRGKLDELHKLMNDEAGKKGERNRWLCCPDLAIILASPHTHALASCLAAIKMHYAVIYSSLAICNAVNIIHSFTYPKSE